MSSKPNISKGASKKAKAANANSKPLGRIANIKQKANKQAQDLALSGELEGVVYGRVTKHLGNNEVRVLCADLREHRAIIAGRLSNRRATPIQIDTVVGLGRREFETRSSGSDTIEGIAEREVFDISLVLDRSTASRMVKHGDIPAWMLTSATVEEINRSRSGAIRGSSGGAGGSPDTSDLGEGFVFDYEGAAEEEAAAEITEKDIDAI